MLADCLTPEALVASTQVSYHGRGYPGLVSHVREGQEMVLRSLDTLGGPRGWVLCADVAADLGLRWKGGSLSVAQHLRFSRQKGWTRSRLVFERDEHGNDKTPQMQWRITPAGRKRAWR